jgi:hypothetical protein
MAVNEFKIENFTLHYDGMYHIETESKEQFKIYINPSLLIRLFQNEGYDSYDITLIWDKKGRIPFTKSVLKMFNFIEDGEIIACCNTDYSKYYEHKGIEVHYVELE